MTVRKIDLMHQMFGKTEGLCGNCSHYKRYHYRDKPYRKCGVYGITNSEASDWVGRYQACWLFNKKYSGNDVIRFVSTERKNEVIQEPLEGQVSIFE